jgi:hypothetical protein
MSKSGKRFRNTCDKFYLCVNNEMSILSCASGMNFDEKLGRCVAASTPGCRL